VSEDLTHSKIPRLVYEGEGRRVAVREAQDREGKMGMINDDMISNHLHCGRKAFLKAAGTPGEFHEIERVRIDLDETYRRRALGVYLARYDEREIVRSPSSLEAAIGSGPRIIVDATATAGNVRSRIQLLERVEHGGRKGVPSYVPMMFVRNDKVTRRDKLLITFQAHALVSVLGESPAEARIVHGEQYKNLRVKVEPLVGQVRGLIEQIEADLGQGDPPALTLNGHCNECEFRGTCRGIAEATDDLSLLRGLSGKEVEKLRGRGIATVAQLSHAYQPGRRGKRRLGAARKHDPALQALALRERKVFVLDRPPMPVPRVALYLDIEGVPDRGSYYLIGLLAVDEGRCTSYSFWADDSTQEKAIWQACAQVIEGFRDYTLYHYGRYEQGFLDRMKRSANDDEAAAIDLIRSRSCNVLGVIYSHFYFPTHSNSLKDIGKLLGAGWSAENASGIQSLAWRLAWESGHGDVLKQQLLVYNQEDCLALRRITEFVLSACNDGLTPPEAGPPVAPAEDIQQGGSFRFRKAEFFCPELDHINRCAYSDYQREKIYVRTSPAIRTSQRRKQRLRKRTLRVNKHIECSEPERCPECGGTQVHINQRPRGHKTVFDLRFSSSGVRRWVTQYSTQRYRCGTCKNTFLADEYRSVKNRIGNNLASWVLYHHVALRQSHEDIELSLNEIFGFSFGYHFLRKTMPWAAGRHASTYERLKEKLRRGHLIHADETKVALKGHSGYVWAFTNLEEVVYVYTPTREGTILGEMLDGFGGVLVSDFYSAYDSAKCAQQKCLIHLARDINDDLFHSPFDEESKGLAQAFVAVLKPIVDTIDKFGLRCCHLRKHKQDVERFFRLVDSADYQSEAARKYQKRIQKYRSSLFTFLDYDSVPWNNNNAENAIKWFASRRKILGASYVEHGIQDYLLLLSIYQTCRLKGVSFLKFLRSGLLDLDTFVNEMGR
jgi:predicted RecB family nuclease